MNHEALNRGAMIQFQRHIQIDDLVGVVNRCNSANLVAQAIPLNAGNNDPIVDISAGRFTLIAD
ncbi:MAG: hypothetical protein OI74_02380 [Gammaproteobacteria bacterium (ex Lamellibrachia satsuma)]|nr:MAG: hypothetical protein OI74_02380 [Gammaproteobacteria bacterium (ex Lamellibrachia satsuma)]